MGKRKRYEVEEDPTSNGRRAKTSTTSKAARVAISTASNGDGENARLASGVTSLPEPPTTVQIVIGTYEKVLHGVTATISKHGKEDSELDVEFADTFLFSAHGSAIRCLAISPTSSSTKSQKVILASGSSDQIINLYHISTESSSRRHKEPSIPTLTGNKILENPRNRELGSLQHHGASVNTLCFPSRSKLLSGAEDNTIAVARTRDWTVLSTIKAPIPKAYGRPSGDTAPPGGTPAGVNDFAIHPSLKLMVSVSKGEKCMRLWNLVTGKKAGVLSFERELLHGVGEGRWGSGEGRKVEWNSLGEEFVVGFERGCVVFSIDSKPQCQISPSPTTKIHQLHYMALPGTDNEAKDILAVSTEDGRILFYDTSLFTDAVTTEPAAKPGTPVCRMIGQLGGTLEGLTGRIKDFEILKPPDLKILLIVTGSSDGAIRLWALTAAELAGRSVQAKDPPADNTKHTPNGDVKTATRTQAEKQVGKLLGTYEAGNRITCLKAFVMLESKSSKTDGLENGTSASGDHGSKDSCDESASI